MRSMGLSSCDEAKVVSVGVLWEDSWSAVSCRGGLLERSDAHEQASVMPARCSSRGGS